MSMQRFKPYLGRTLDAGRMTESVLAAHGARARFVPDEIQPFDEVEIAFPRAGAEDLLLTLAVEDGRVARMLFGAATAGDDDADARGLSEAELAEALAAHGDAAAALLDGITA